MISPRVISFQTVHKYDKVQNDITGEKKKEKRDGQSKDQDQQHVPISLCAAKSRLKQQKNGLKASEEHVTTTLKSPQK